MAELGHFRTLGLIVTLQCPPLMVKKCPLAQLRGEYQIGEL